MQVERGGVADDPSVAFWRRYARSASFLDLSIVVINTAYVLSTWSSGRNRPALLIINLLALAGIAFGILTRSEEAIAESRYQELIFGGWCFGGAALVTYAVWADGGLSSPLAWLFPLAVMFAAFVHGPRLVVFTGVSSLAGLLLVGALDGAPALAVRAAYLVALTCAAATAARFRSARDDEESELRRKLSELADHDGLTGLLNHRAFHEHLAAALATAARRGEPVSVLLIDLDRFKAVNDEHGHLTGDGVLQAVAGCLTESVRAGDVVARIGGEEFAVLLPGTGVDETGAAAERIRVAIAALTTPVCVTASIGVSSTPGCGVGSSELLEQADGALYDAKRRGRNQVCWLRVA